MAATALSLVELLMPPSQSVPFLETGTSKTAKSFRNYKQTFPKWVAGSGPSSFPLLVSQWDHNAGPYNDRWFKARVANFVKARL